MDAANVQHAYHAAASSYAAQFYEELEHKPFDRMLLARFAQETNGHGLVCDLGCGPGEIGDFLGRQGASVVGIDFAKGMLVNGQRLNPAALYACGDMRRLPVRHGALAGIAAFYAIVHTPPEMLPTLFQEWRRVLREGAPLVLSFHVGNQVLHVDGFLGTVLSLDFVFHDPDQVLAALTEAGFSGTEVIIRYPYDGVEYGSRRCYLYTHKAPVA